MFYPPVTFHPLPEDSHGARRSRLPYLSRSRACSRGRKLASLGFASLQHIPGWGVHLTGVCLAPYVPLSGFGSTLLAASSSPRLWTIFQVQAFLGFSPSEFYSLRRATPLSRFVALLPSTIESDVIQRTTRSTTAGLQSFAPVGEPRSPPPSLDRKREPLLSWSFHL
jgi:hypothetical protein